MSTPEYDHARFIRYSGYNPNFFRRVREKQRREREAAQARADAEKAMEAKRRREALDRIMANAQDLKSYGCITVISINDKPPPKEIIAQVAAIYGIPVADIVGRRRSVPIVEARHAAIKAVADRRPDLSLPQIGRFFGNRDHTTILNALNKFGGRAKQGGSHV